MVTLKQVAEDAGVSLTTVSFVLNGRAVEMKISKECIERVKESAQRLGYRGNYHAKSLIRGKSNTIGITLPFTIRHKMWGSIAAGVNRTARAGGMDVLIIDPDKHETGIERGMKYLSEKRIDALIVGGSIPREYLEDSAAKLPIVTVEAEDGAEASFPDVSLDAVPGIEQALDHLAQFGHKRILYIGKRNRHVVMVPQRFDTFRKKTAELGLEAFKLFLEAEKGYIGQLEWHIEHYHEQLKVKWNTEQGVTAVICFNDTMALALYALCAERAIRIPDDISIIGFNNLHGSNTIPGMTTISHMFTEIGDKAMQVALELIDNKKNNGNYIPPTQIKVPAKLIVRGSTGPVPASPPTPVGA